MPPADRPHPRARAIDGLVEQVAALRQRVDELEAQRKELEEAASLDRPGEAEPGATVQPLRQLADG
jgi:hypothetical protein